MTSWARIAGETSPAVQAAFFETSMTPTALYASPAVRLQLCREAPGLYREKLLIQRPEHAYQAIADVLAPLAQERFVTLNLDNRSRLLSVTNVSEGSASSCPVDPRVLFAAALLAGARQLVLAHNHPSGDPSPSWDDLHLTERLVRAGRILDLPVTDHIVVGDGRFVSLRTDHEDLFR